MKMDKHERLSISRFNSSEFSADVTITVLAVDLGNPVKNALHTLKTVLIYT